MATDLRKIRNMGVIAHIDAGKTTVTERMLFESGFSHKAGEVDKGTTVTDYDPEEQQRGITIYSACVTFPWREHQINLIDTPGHVDFTAEVERSLRVLDGGVVVFSAREGVEAQSETVWRQADRYHVPRLAFINKMDREGADFPGTVEEIRERLAARPVPLNIPIGAGPPHVKGGFCGVIDLIAWRKLTFTDIAHKTRVLSEEIPDESLSEARTWRTLLFDQLSLFSDELTELVLAEEPIPEDLVRRVVREATLHNMIVPVFCGSALDWIGVQPVLDGVVDYLPGPLDVPPVQGTDPKRPEVQLARKADPAEPFCGLVFKVIASKHGDWSLVRLYSGELKANSRVLNPGKDKKENVPQIWRIQADRREQIPLARTGEIVGLIGLRHSVTGDTLCDPKAPILLESIQFPETVISMAIEPENSAERKKLSEVLDMLKRQDPTFRAREDEQSGQTLISGMGELHLEIIKHMLLREHRLNVRVHTPRVSYRETVEGAAEVTGTCHRTMGGQTLFAELTLRVEPFEGGPRPVTVAVASSEGIPAPLLTAAVEVLSEQGEGGGLLGFPLTQVKITVLGGVCREGESNDVAFRIAAGDAFEKGLREAGVVLLEPIMRLEITTPEEHLGDFVSDLLQRRGSITRTHTRGRNTVIEAQAPLANLFGYSGTMRGLSQGRATCTMEPAAYGPAPPEVLAGFM